MDRQVPNAARCSAKDRYRFTLATVPRTGHRSAAAWRSVAAVKEIKTLSDDSLAKEKADTMLMNEAGAMLDEVISHAGLASAMTEVSVFLCARPERLFHGAARYTMQSARACGAVVKSVANFTSAVL